MALTKVSGGILDPGINVAGIVTATGFDGPFTGGSSSNINAGIITATGFDLNGNGDISGNLVIGGNLTANGDFTTLNTTLREVEILRVDANTTAVAGIITQRGSGDIFSVYDTSTEVFKIADGGAVSVLATGDNKGLRVHSNSGISATNNELRFNTGQSSGFTFMTNSDGGASNERLNLNADGVATFSSATGINTGVKIQQTALNHNAGLEINATNGGQARLNLKTSKSGTNRAARIDFYNQNAQKWTLINDFDQNGTNDLSIRYGIDGGSWGEYLTMNPGSSVELYFNNNKRFTSSNYGTDLFGQSTAAQLRFKTQEGTNRGMIGVTNANVISILDAQDHAVLRGYKDGACELYHDNIKTAFTSLDAWNVYGRTSNSAMVEIASNQGANNNDRFRIHKTSAASRLTIQNYSTGSWVENIRITAGGAVELKHSNGTTHFETTAGGAAISNIQNNEGLNLNGVGNNTCIKFLSTGSSPAHGYRIAYHSTTNYAFNSPSITFDKIATNGNFSNHVAAISDTGLHLPDNMKLHVGGTTGASGATGDLQIYHASSDNNSYIVEGGTGSLMIQGDIINIGNVGSSKYYIRCFEDGAVQLRYGNNLTKLATTATGIEVTGEVAASQDYPNFRPTIDFNFAAEKKLDPRITYQRTGPASFVNEFGKVVIVGDNAPRFDHDPITRECKGLLIEESRTNIHPYSQDLSNWTVESGGSVTANTHISPAGDQTADSLNGTQAGSSAYRTFSLTSGTAYTFTVFLKYVSGNTNIQIQIGDAPFTRSYTTFNTSTGALVSTSGGTQTVNDVVAFPNGWYRVSITRTPTSTASGFMDINHTSSTASTVAVWGAQIETGSFATSYIPTTDATNVTRGEDVVRIMDDDFTDIFGTEFENFSVVADFDNSNSFDGNNASIIEWWSDDNNYENRIQIMKDNSSPYHIETRAISGNSGIFANGNLSASSKAATNRFATSWSVDYSTNSGASRRWAFSFSGEDVDVVGDDSSTAVPTFTRFGIGCSPRLLNLTRGVLLFKRLMVYNQTLSDNQLRTLSA